LRGPNHGEGAPTFHDLRLGWAPCAARFGLKIRLELTQAGFGTDEGEIVALLDPAPALTAFRAVHRGILRQVTVVAAVGGGRYEAAQGAGLRDGGEAAASRGPLRRRIGRPRRNAAELSLHDQRGDRLAAAARHHGAPGAAGARRGGRSGGRRGCGGGGAAGMIALLCAAVFDLILSGGRVVDGTGSPWFRADVGIRGDS